MWYYQGVYFIGVRGWLGRLQGCRALMNATRLICLSSDVQQFFNSSKPGNAAAGRRRLLTISLSDWTQHHSEPFQGRQVPAGVMCGAVAATATSKMRLPPSEKTQLLCAAVAEQ